MQQTVILLLICVPLALAQCTTPGCSTTSKDNIQMEELKYLLERQAKQLRELQAKVDLIPTDCQNNRVYRDCNDLLIAGFLESGVYLISIHGIASPVAVYCDMETDGGGWLVFQRRYDGTLSFNRTWADYAKGFGDASEEFWLGNRILHLISNNKEHEMRVEVRRNELGWNHATYRQFSLASERNNFRIGVGNFSGDINDALHYHNGQPFSTYDRDLDSWDKNCALSYGGGWWFANCARSNLNAPYEDVMDPTKAVWNFSPTPPQGGDMAITQTKMMLRPL